MKKKTAQEIIDEVTEELEEKFDFGVFYPNMEKVNKKTIQEVTDENISTICKTKLN